LVKKMRRPKRTATEKGKQNGPRRITGRGEKVKQRKYKTLDQSKVSALGLKVKKKKQGGRCTNKPKGGIKNRSM